MNLNFVNKIRHPESGFTLLEIVAALALFAFIVIEVLADREASIHLSGDARVIQTVRYLAAAKMDEVANFPDRFDDSQSGAFDDLDEEAPYQDFSSYTWDLEVERVLAIGAGDGDAEKLFEGDDTESYPTDTEGNDLQSRYVRRVVLTVRFEPNGEFQPELSVKLQTFLPDLVEDEEEEQ